MSQHDYIISNATFPNVRADLNLALGAVATNNAGNSAPSTTYANQWWFDSDGNTLYLRNKDNDAWCQVLTIGATSDLQTITTDLIAEVTSAAGVTVDGVLLKDGAVGAAGTATSVAGIPFYQGDTGSIYTHDVSGTDSTAQYNTAYGLNALDAITTGDGNVAVGYQAGTALTTGNVTAIGHRAGDGLTTGGGGVHIGYDAGRVYDTENHNIGIGNYSLGSAIAGGEYNVAIGSFALDALTSGDNNVAVGYNAGSAITTAEATTAIGDSALMTTTTGNSNVAVGANTLKLNTTASYNTAVGSNSLDANTTGAGNTAVGYATLSANTTAAGNTAVGYEALLRNTTGANNTAVGYNAGGTMTTGLENVIIGSDAVGTGVMTAGQGVFIGNDAGLNKTSGSSCIFIGYQAGEQVTTGGSNIFIGRNAGDDHDTENNNLGIGQDALGGSIAGGEYNVAVGNFALDALTSGDGCTAVGYNAGTSITSGGQNTLFGQGAGGSITTGAGNVCIGKDAGNTGTILVSGNNCIYIGQGIRGTGEANSSEIVIGSLNVTGKGGQTAFINPDGGSVYNGANATTWNTVSDKRIKKNIIDNNTGLDAINKIQVRDFEYRTVEEITDFDNPESAVVDKQGTQLGVIAQEIEEILPELITTETTGVKTVNADNLTWYLINAVKELSAEIKALKGE